MGEEDCEKSVKSLGEIAAVAASNWLFMPNSERSICVICDTMLLNKSAGITVEANDKSVLFMPGKVSIL